MRALWYRHWLELRSGFYLSLVLVLLPLMAFAAAVAGLTSQDDTGRYVRFATLVALVAPFALFGSGYASQQPSAGPHHPSVYFTLSLPITRRAFVATRLSAGAALMASLLIIVLVGQLAASLALGRPVALVAMAVTTLLVLAMGVAMLAVIGLLTLLANEGLRMIVLIPIFLVVWFIGRQYMNALASVTRPLTTLTLLLGATAIVLGLTILAAQRKEL